MEIKFNWEGHGEDFVTVKEWKKHGKFRLYIEDHRGKQWGFIDVLKSEWNLNGSGSPWKDCMKPAVESYAASLVENAAG